MFYAVFLYNLLVSLIFMFTFAMEKANNHNYVE